LLKPEVLNQALDHAESLLQRSEIGTLVFGSALNL